MPNKYPSSASTMTPTHVTAPKFTGTQVDTTQFTLSNTTVDGITHSIDTNDPTKLLTAFGGKYLHEELTKLIDDLTNKINNLKMTPVLSDPLLPVNFIGNNWQIDGWYLDNGKAIYLNKNSIGNNNKIKIKTDVFTENGDYFLYFNIDTISGGRLILKNEKGETLKTYSTAERHEITFSVDEPSLAYIELIAQNVPANGTIVLDYCSLHHVKTAFEIYVEYLLERLSSGDFGFVSDAELEQAILETIQKSQSYTNTVVNNITDNINSHIQDTNNPHGTTYLQVGAAARNHTHSEYALKTDVINQIEDAIEASETGILSTLNNHIRNKNNPHNTTYAQVGAAPTKHTHELSDIGPNGAADATHTHTPVSIGAADRTHTHTPSSIGAADREHTHTLDELGAAAKEHTHSQYIDRDEVTSVIEDILDDVQSDINTNLNKHIQDTNNPHKTTYAQVGAAASNHTHIPEDIGAASIHHTHDSSDIDGLDNYLVNIDNITTNVDTISDTLNSHISNFNNPHNTDKEDVGLGDVINGGMATTQEAIDGQLEDKYMNPSNTKDVLDYYGNTINPILAQTLTPKIITNIDAGDEVVNITVQPNHIYQICIDFYNTSADCTLSFGSNYTHTSCGNVIGNGVNTTYGFNDKLVIAREHSSSSKCKLEINTTLGTVVGNQLYLENSSLRSVNIYGLATSDSGTLSDVSNIALTINGNANIKIYELVATNEDPAMVIDAQPKGNIISRYGKTVIPGYTILDGSELIIAKHQDLFDYAQEANLFVELDIYDEEVLAQGYTEHFGYNEGDTTFRIPKDGISDNGLYRYMKIDDVYVPNTKQVLYRYIWN